MGNVGAGRSYKQTKLKVGKKKRKRKAISSEKRVKNQIIGRKIAKRIKTGQSRKQAISGAYKEYNQQEKFFKEYKSMRNQPKITQFLSVVRSRPLN